MELNPTARLRRNEPLNRPAAKAKAAGSPSERAQSSADRLSLSRQAVAYLKEQTRRNQEALARQQAEKAREKAEGTGDGSQDALMKAMKKMKKCQQIAARIMSGGKVPPEDERYLMENDPEGYKLAMAARKPKKRPKKWDSVLDKEDREGTEASSGEDGTASASGEAVPSGEAS